jgi:hypothetical protein
MKLITLMLALSLLLPELSQATVDTPSAIAQLNHRHFQQIVVRLKSNLFRGRAQNFSSFNLDLDTFVHLNQDHLTGVHTFNLASNGNPTINGVPVWPIAGRVQSSLPGVFQLEGSEVTFSEREGLFYFVESDKSFKERTARWDLLKHHPMYRDYLGSRGRLVGVGTLDLYTLEVEFYELNPETEELVRAGVLDSSVVRRH